MMMMMMMLLNVLSEVNGHTLQLHQVLGYNIRKSDQEHQGVKTFIKPNLGRAPLGFLKPNVGIANGNSKYVY
jgi:hypothetical protein